ncbi:MAG: AhpC/TSA family protein [Chitinophagaceae bacterium]|nr:AhpC/TSA family protein [Chitinophagaceae bacterium]
MMQKNLLFSVLGSFIISSAISQASSSNWFSIKAFLPSWNQSVVQLEVDGQIIQTDTVRGDLVAFTGTTSDVKPALLKVRKEKTTYFLPFFIEPGTIKIRDAGHNILHASGTYTNDRYVLLIKRFDSLSLVQNKRSFDEVKEYQRQLAAEFIKENPHSIISLQLLKEYFFKETKADDQLYYFLFNSLDDALKNSYTGKKVAEEVKGRYATAIGMVAPFSTLPDTEGNLKALYEDGKYTLLVFWMSNCLPCRKENPALLNVFKKYVSDSFTIVAVSFDTDKQLWKRTITVENLPWQHLNDGKGWNGPASKAYGVKVIPINFLVDKNGVIIAKHLTPEELDVKLGQLFQKTGNKF